MQSDERIGAALSALRPQISLYRFAVSSTIERAGETLASESRPSQARVALGNFAGGRIDPERFAMVSSASGPLDVISRAVVERATEVLESISRAGDEAFVVVVQPGESPAAAIRDRLATLGSAFGAAALVELVRRRTYDPAQHGLLFEGYPFVKWTIAERKLAPPLVVQLDGRNLDPFDLAPLIDGTIRLVLLVDGQCAPAPLARLISPGAFVAQADDMKILERLTGFDGPAVVAIMNGNEARFVHDPRTGSAMWQRIDVTRVPDGQPRKSFGARSAWQQRDELAHLVACSAQPVLPSDTADALLAAIGGGMSDPAERLTAWLLDQDIGAVTP